MRMGRNSMKSVGQSHFTDCANEVGELNNGKVKDGPHRISHRASQVGAARRFTNKESVHLECRTVSDKRTKIFSVRQSVNRNKEARMDRLLEGFCK
jgi:hypothetical protein